MRWSPLRAVLTGGLIAGACDITYALVFTSLRGVAPMRLLQSVASGLLGTHAYAGGVATAALGLLLHFLICIAAAGVFYAVARRVGWLVEHAVLAGSVFGVCVFMVMNFVVVPLSAFPHKLAFPPIVLYSGLAVHMFLVGVPIAWCARKALRASMP